ncbi:MAG: lipoyl(octanoyl) transferase LipB [Cytophagales bacterium]|nr:lipoyl(octanoyl) transferase LipB [Cytophagales bacterium]
MTGPKNTKVGYEHWGIIPYQEAFDKQLLYFQNIIDTKIKNRESPAEEITPTPNYLFTCEHTHVYTLGRSGKEDHLLLNEKELQEQDIQYIETTRGGDITYHGPGQLLAYPILDLDNFFTDIHKYMRLLEETVIATVAHFGIKSERIPGLTGVWISENRQIPAKICAMGVKTSRWVTMHGIGLNVNTNLEYFNHIVPCGISDKSVTSIQQEIGSNVDMDEVIEVFLENFTESFNCNMVNLSAQIKNTIE